MSFQFFSKLDQKFTDGPVSKIDPDRGMRDIAQGGGEMGKAVQASLRAQKDQKRMARRAYRTAMRSGNVNDLANAAQMVNQAGGRFMSPYAQERAAEKELDSRGGSTAFPNRRGEVGGSLLDRQPGARLGTEPGLGQTAPQGQSVDSEGRPVSLLENRQQKLSAAEESRLKTRELTLAGNFGEAAKARLEAEDAKASFVGPPRSIFEKQEAEKSKSNKDLALNDADAINKGLSANDQAQISAIEETERLKKYSEESGLSEAMNKLEAISEKSRLNSEARTQAQEIRKAEFDKQASDTENARLGKVKAAEDRFLESQKQLAVGSEIREMQTKVTDDYFAAAELSDSNVYSAGFNSLVGNDGKPFIPHGVFSGKISEEAKFNADPQLYKKAIDSGKAFNEALGGKDVTVKYTDKGMKTLPNGQKVPNKIKVLGDEAVTGKLNKAKTITFQNDAFTMLKEQALGNPSLAAYQKEVGGLSRWKMGDAKGSKNQYGQDLQAEKAVTAMDKIVQAAVDNNYPIELDGDLMANPMFVKKLHTARAKTGMMKSPKGYVYFQSK